MSGAIYHVDKFGVELRGDPLLIHDDGRELRLFADAYRLPGDYAAIMVMDTSQPGIAGTSVRYVDSRKVRVATASDAVNAATTGLAPWWPIAVIAFAAIVAYKVLA